MKPLILNPVLDPTELAQAIRTANPAIDPVVAHTTADAEKLITEARVVLTSSFLAGDINERLFHNADQLEWVQTLTSGVDAYDLQSLRRQGAIVTNVRGIHAEPIAQQVFAYILAFERDLLRAIQQHTESIWHRYTADELTDKTLGILGVGSIGERAAELAKAFGMRTAGVKTTVTSETDVVDELYTPDKQHKMLEQADYVLISCPLNSDTKGLIDYNSFVDMKSDAVLINIGRGEIIHESDLIQAIKNDLIGGAALDVFDTEPLPTDSDLWDHPKVIITPHNAGSTSQYWRRCAEIFASNFELFQNEEYDNMDNRIL